MRAPYQKGRAERRARDRNNLTHLSGQRDEHGTVYECVLPWPEHSSTPRHGDYRERLCRMPLRGRKPLVRPVPPKRVRRSGMGCYFLCRG